MPAYRIIPCLDVRAQRVVKGVRFRGLRDMGDPVELARRYRDEGADELVFLDVAATVEERAALPGVVASVADVLDIPFTVGGGVRGEADAAELLLGGADKVAVNSAAVAAPDLLARLARRFGRQCIVLAVDARRRREPGRAASATAESATGSTGATDRTSSSSEPRASTACWEVVTHAGTRPTGRDALAWAVEGVERGAGEVLLTSMDRDGTAQGFDVELLAAARSVCEVPLVASGGGNDAAHFLAAWRAGADAGLAATIFHAGRLSIADLKRSLAAEGVPVRLEGS
jgi:imidazole glycerol-phosphate synthase subunit HisF